MFERLKSIPITLVVVIFLLGALSFKVYSGFVQKKEMAVSASNWSKLNLILGQIDRHYVDSVNQTEITEKAIPFILEKLDPHSLYLPPTELQSAEEQLMGNFDGIGIQFNVPNDTAIVINVIPGGPSERAGILSGDRLVKVDGEMVAGVQMIQDSLVKRLRGKSGTIVKVDVKRMGSDKLISFDITRDKIPMKSVDVHYMINDTLGYIKLSKFTRTSYTEFMEAIKSLRSDGMKSVIFDLRGNSGGYFDQALLLSNEFLHKGELIVYMQGRNRPRQDFFADNSGSCRDIGIKVLIDEGSASSSEIFAGAIQDNDRGVIYGRRSFGKGLVQEPVYFSDNSGIRLTVARFYTPTGRSIQKPYSEENYRDDIMERYRHGEMLNADSIRQNDSLKYITPKGKVVYGGGGITPDVFVPVDTVGVTPFFIKVSNQGLTFRFSAMMADVYRKELNQINTLRQLDEFFDNAGMASKFIQYAADAGVKASPAEWKESGDIVLAHIKAFVGRYSPMDDRAFYPVLLAIDNVVLAAIGQ
ncbi:MAG: S41 family peptidase [Bacteroidia bacterium]|nr:S41 family peptidase [Bacteroidia bacterium]